MKRDLLDARQLRDKAQEHLRLFGREAYVTLVFPQRHLGKTRRRRRLCGTGSPLGRPLCESIQDGGLVMSFKARDVVAWLA